MDNVYEQYNKIKMKYLARINSFETDLLGISQDELHKRVDDLRANVVRQLTVRYNKLTPQQDLLQESDDIFTDTLPLAFALAREVTRRVLGMRHYDEQIVGGIALHMGSIAELKNGEGKTIVALLPAFLNALFVKAEYEIKSGQMPNFKKRSVHIITTNDYLARRDYVWLRPVYEFLGVSVGYLQAINPSKPSYNMSLLERRTMYTADIIYGAIQEFIFDFLRDNHQSDKRYWVQSEKYLAILDEVDHALLDEARTPHILSDTKSGFSKQDLELVYLVNHLARELYRDRHVLVLVNLSNLVPTGTGANIIRIFGKNLISDRSMHSTIDRQFSGEEILGLMFELIYFSTRPRKAQIGEPLFREIEMIFRKVSKHYTFYETDAKGQITGLQRNFKEKIADLMVNSWRQEEAPDFRDFVSLLELVMKHVTTFNEILVSSGLTAQEVRKILTQADAIKLVRSLLSGQEEGLRQTALLLTDILELFVIEIPEISLADINRLRLFIREITVFLLALLPRWGNGFIHHEYLGALNRIADIYMSGLSKTNNSLAPEAFLNIASSVVFPIISNLFAPRKPLQTHNKLVIVAILMLKTFIVASQIEQPKNKVERQLHEMFHGLQKVITNHLFTVNRTTQQVYLTYWSELIAEAYARQIADFKLWEEGKSQLLKLEMEDLTYRISFLLKQSLIAYALHQNNNQYVVGPTERRAYDEFTRRPIDRDIVIIGELTGRVMPGRRWQQWVHSFLEAKENLPVRQELRSTASVSAQAYFKMYPKIGGMTGTAHIGVQKTSAGLIGRAFRGIRKLVRSDQDMQLVPLNTDPLLLEFKKTYNMEVVVVPQHRPNQRQDLPDIFFWQRQSKLNAIIAEIIEIHQTGRPILVETVSVAQSIEIAKLLEQHSKSENIQVHYKLLNALNDEQEAEIITQAGLPGAITISTQLAGRGTDIVISQEAILLGGLYVLGVERRWSRRWDNQVAGRSGRQGEPGTSKFFLCYDDEILAPTREQAFAFIKKQQELVSADDDVGMQFRLLSDSFYVQQVNYEYHSGIVRAQTEEFDQVLGKYRNFILKRRAASFDEAYPCPVCRNMEHQVSILSEELACSWCGSIGSDRTDIFFWRSYFGTIIASTVEGLLRKDSLEADLIEKYASSYNPAEWDWDDMVAELNKWIKTPATKSRLTEGINLSNILDHQDEVLKLKRNIFQALENDRRLRLLAAATEIMNAFDKREHDWRLWDFQELFQQINASIGLDIPVNVYTKLDQLGGRSKIRKEVLKIIDSAIRYSLSQKSVFSPKDQTLLQIISSLAPYISEMFTVQMLRKAVEENKLEEFFTRRFVQIYNGLVARYDKVAVYKLENEIFREEIDEMWCQFLSESQIRLNGLRGETPKDRLADYNYQMAELFDRRYAEACLSFISRVFESGKELAKQEEESKLVLEQSWISASDLCTCQSGRQFMDCCGKQLYKYLGT